MCSMGGREKSCRQEIESNVKDGIKEEIETKEPTHIKSRYDSSNLKRWSCRTCGACVKMRIIFHNSIVKERSIQANRYLLENHNFASDYLKLDFIHSLRFLRL